MESEAVGVDGMEFTEAYHGEVTERSSSTHLVEPLLSLFSSSSASSSVVSECG